ncbi:MAG: ATP-dependent Clp protease adaptor ClpS [Zavarzinella sp.]
MVHQLDLATPLLDPETVTRTIPPYHLILLNDDHHTMEFVVMVLQKIMGFTLIKSFEHTLQAHQEGQSIIWTGSKEVAELKAEQIATVREQKGSRDIGPVDVVIEPAS